MGSRRWPWEKPQVRTPSTLPEAREALVQARIEHALVNQQRARVEEAASVLANERETNHMAERFRAALRGGEA